MRVCVWVVWLLYVIIFGCGMRLKREVSLGWKLKCASSATNSHEMNILMNCVKSLIVLKWHFKSKPFEIYHFISHRIWKHILIVSLKMGFCRENRINKARKKEQTKKMNKSHQQQTKKKHNTKRTTSLRLWLLSRVLNIHNTANSTIKQHKKGVIQT